MLIDLIDENRQRLSLMDTPKTEDKRQRSQRGIAEFELTLALGRADIRPESPLTISGYKPQIDATA